MIDPPVEPDVRLEWRPHPVLLIKYLAAAMAISIAFGSGVSATLWDASPAGTGLLIPPVICILLAAGAVSLHFASIRYFLTDRYVGKQAGVLWRKRRLIPLEKITNIDVAQGPLESAFGVGRVGIYTPSTGSSKPEETLSAVADPHRVSALIEQRMETMKSARVDVSHEGDGLPRSEEDLVSLLREIRDSLVRIERSLGGEDRETKGK